MKRRNLIFLAFFVAIVCSNCSAVRKKNKCNSCPTWDQVEESDGFTAE